MVDPLLGAVRGPLPSLYSSKPPTQPTHTHPPTPSPTRQRTHTHTHRGYTHNLTHTRPHAPAPRASQCTPCLRAWQ